MRLPALLLLAALAGFLVGRLTVREKGGRGGERSAPAKPEREVPAADAVVQPEVPKTDAETEPAPSTDDPVPPTSRPVEEGFDGGTLEIDFEGLDGDRAAWLGWFHLNGGFEESELQAGEDVVLALPGLQAGVYHVCWMDAEGRRVGTRARVENGRVTTVRAVAYRDPAPVPRGLGVLNIYVEGADGGGLSVNVGVETAGNSTDFWTNRAGYGSRAFLPGRYAISVGHHRSEAVVEEGRATFHRVAHGSEGDLLIAATQPMTIWLEPVGRDGLVWAGNVGEPGAAEVAPYLPEGEYDVFLKYSLGTPLARVAIHAGRATRFHCESPRGGVIVRVAPESTYIDLRLIRIRDAEERESESTRLAPSELSEPFMLLPGRYRLTASAPGREPRSADIDVSDRIIEVVLDLPPLR